MNINKQRFHLTASEIAMGRVMRAPDHPKPADDEFTAAFADFKDEKPAAGAAGEGGAGDAGEAGAAAAGGGESDGAGDGGADGAAGADGGAQAPAGDGDAGAAAADDKSGAAAADDKAGAAAGDDKGGAAGAAAGAADDKGGAAAKDAQAPDAEADEAILKRLAAAVKNVDDKPAAKAGEGAEAPETPLFNDDETAKIEHFKKEWPEVAEAFDLQARAVAHSVLKYAFDQIGGVIGPMRETLGILAERTHLGDIKEKVGDYDDDLVGEVTEWVKTQPTYLQAGMLSVIQEGTAEETADLVGRYREATGKKPAGAPADTTGAEGGGPELSDTAKQAAGELAPVSSKRSAVQAQEDSSDFGAAFTKFADQIG